MSESDDLGSLLGNDAELASADNPFAPPSESQPAGSLPQASSPLASEPAIRNPGVPTPAPVDVAGPPMAPSASAPIGRREERTAPLAAPVAGAEAPASAMFWRPGTMLAGRYTLLEELGHGGMGRVFKARDMQLTRDVAIKVMRASMRMHEHAASLTDRFQAEALLPASINHPNIIAIFDRGTHGVHDETFPFFVMEYLPHARSLHEEIQSAKASGFIALGRIQSWMLQATNALASLHATGAWHRDIKPANFVIYPLHDGEHLKLLDFGIAHLPESDLTMDGNFLGTPSYMAPEFFEIEDGKSVELDYRGDLFALGITLYQCLTLQHPYPSVKTPRDALAAYKGGISVLPPSHHRPGLPPAWDHLTLALLERDRAKRLQPATKVLAALRALPTAELDAAAAASELLANDAVAVSQSVVVRASSPAHQAAREVPPRALPAPASRQASSHVTPSESGESGPASLAAVAAPGAQASPPTDWANAFRPESGAPRKRAMGAFMLAGGALVIVFAVLAVVFSGISNRTAKTNTSANAWNMPGEQKPPADAWMKEVESAPLFPSSRGRSAAPASQHEQPQPVEHQPSAANSAPPESAGSDRPTKRGSGKAARGASAPPAAAADDNPWSALYGSGGPTNNGAISVRNGGDGRGDSGSVQGKRLDARLIDKVASRPTGAAVIVKLTKEAKLGTHTFPVGAEVHGKVTGADGARIFVSFEFIRFGDNEVVRINGVVRGKDGRQGLPGKKQLDGSAGQSVATTGASSAISGVAGAAAGAIAGPVAGGVVQGVGDSASQKVERLDNDEALVVATGNTPVVVYVTAMPDG